MKRVPIGLSLLLCLAAPAHRLQAQATTYWATGGDIFLTMIGFNSLPFQLFMEAVSAPGTSTLLFEETGAAFSVEGGPMILNQLLSANSIVDLGTFATGDQLRFTMLTSQGPVIGAGILAQFLGGVQVEMISGSGQLHPNETRAEFRLQGVGSVSDNYCTRNSSPDLPCINPTVTPEPATLALVGTGLIWIAGLAGVRASRRSAKGAGASPTMTEAVLP